MWSLLSFFELRDRVWCKELTYPEDLVPPSAFFVIHISGPHTPDVFAARICSALVVLSCHGSAQHLPPHTFFHLNIQHHHLHLPN